MITSRALLSPSVQAHEAVHGRIFQETADGQLHRLLCKANGTEIDKKFDNIYNKAAKQLFVETRCAHEAAATYLTIQGMPTTKIRKSLLRELSKEYRGYYDILSLIIDPTSKTTWLRYAFAWTLIHWAFSSRRSKIFFEESEPSLDFTDIMGPTERLVRASKFLRNGRRLRKWVDDSLKVARADYAATGRVLWNIEVESAWNDQEDDTNIKIFENFLTSAAGDWLLEHVPIESLFFPEDSGAEGPGFDLLVKELGIVPKRVHTHKMSATEPSWHRDIIESRAYAHGQDVIERSNLHPVDDLTKADIVTVLSRSLSAAEVSERLLLLIDNGEEEYVTALFRKGGYKSDTKGIIDTGTLRITMQNAILLLKTALKFIKPSNINIMIGVERKNMMAASKLAIILAGNPESKKFEFDIPNENIMFYMWDNWAGVYDAPDTAFFSKSIAFQDIENEDPRPFSLRMALLPLDFPKYLLTIKSGFAAHRLDEFENMMMSEGSLISFEIKEDALQNIIVVLGDAWHVWSKF